MILPKNLSGPQFEDGDLVSFIFDDCELTLKLPVIPNYSDRVDDVSIKKDFRRIDTSDWRRYGKDQCLTTLITQKWIYECDISHDDIALCYMDIQLLHQTDPEGNDYSNINPNAFKARQLHLLVQEFKKFEAEIQPQQPSAHNDYFAKSIKKATIDGLQVELLLSDATPIPALCGLFSLGKQFTLSVEWHFSSLHYPDRKNPYSDELLHQMKFELFDEFVSYIDIQYTTETLALIEKLKAQ